MFNQKEEGKIWVPKLVGVKELAQILNVSEDTIYYWKSRRYITPLIDTGRVIRFDAEKVLIELAAMSAQRRGQGNG